MKSDIEKYIDEQPEEDKVILSKIRKIILDEFSEAEERFSWKMPLIYYKGKVLFFANFKKHIGIYPEPEAIVHFQDKLVKYKTSKGAIQFQKNEEIPYDLILEIAKFNVKRNLDKLDK